MEYYHLLFTRGQSFDYEWVVCPEIVTERDKATLRNIFTLCQSSLKKITFKEQLTPYVYIHFPNIIVLLEYVKTRFTDPSGRNIFALQGICVQNVYARHMAFILPWLIREQRRILNVIDINNINLGADETHSPISLSRYIMNLNDFKPSNKVDSPTPSLPYGSILPYDERSYNHLYHIISSSLDLNLDVYFGVSQQILSFLPNNNYYLASLDGTRKSSIQTNPPPQSMQPRHPSERFNPLYQETSKPPVKNTRPNLFSWLFGGNDESE